MTKLLNDIPIDEDEFGIHEKIKNQLKNIINNLNEIDKKTILFYGDWGAGKTSVIKMLKKDYEENGNDKQVKTKIFIYYSWKQKEDFVKKYFLLSLAKNLKVEDKEIPISDDKPELKIPIKDFINSKVMKKSQLNIILKWWHRLIFAILSVIILLSLSGIDLLYFLKKSPFKNYIIDHITLFWGSATLIILISVIFLIKKNFYKVFISPESTMTEEFFNLETEDLEDLHFTHIFKNIVEKSDYEQIIIVLDNLDRVNFKIFEKFIFLIRNIEESVELLKNKKIIIVVPIDKKQLYQQYKKLYSIKEGNSKKEISNCIQKMFPFFIEIPDIKEATWKEYLKKMLQNVFTINNKSQNDKRKKYLFNKEKINIITEMFGDYGRKANNFFTPRGIKYFINQLVINYTMWEEKIPIEYQALYVFFSFYNSEQQEKDLITNMNGFLKEYYLLWKMFDLPDESGVDDIIKNEILKQYYKTEKIYQLLPFNNFFSILTDFRKKNQVNDILDTIPKNYKKSFIKDSIANGIISLLREVCVLIYNIKKEIKIKFELNEIEEIVLNKSQKILEKYIENIAKGKTPFDRSFLQEKEGLYLLIELYLEKNKKSLMTNLIIIILAQKGYDYMAVINRIRGTNRNKLLNIIESTNNFIKLKIKNLEFQEANFSEILVNLERLKENMKNEIK